MGEEFWLIAHEHVQTQGMPHTEITNNLHHIWALVQIMAVVIKIWGCSHWTRLPILGLKGTKTGLIIHVITCEVTRPIWPQ